MGNRLLLETWTGLRGRLQLYWAAHHRAHGLAGPKREGHDDYIRYVLDATDEWRQAVAFPETPLLYYSLAVLACEAFEVTDWADLNDPSIRISVLQATSMDAFLTANTPVANIQRFPGNAAAIAAFQAGAWTRSRCSIRR